MNSNSLNEASKDITFVKEIQMMMFGLGDSPTPLQTTAEVLEKIVLQQMLLIIGKAEEIAERRGVDGIYPQDILFLMRKDVHKLKRIINYIGFKDMKKGALNALSDGDMPVLEELTPSNLEQPWSESKRKLTCYHFLESIGINVNDVTGVDTVNLERNQRRYQLSQTISDKSYVEYAQSRSVTFANAKLGETRFIEWIKQASPDGKLKLKSFSPEMLLYLAKETIAHVIDIALLLRQDKSVTPSDPFSRAQLISRPSETFGPSQQQLEGPPPITPDEVREVLRRFQSPQLCPWAPFTRDIDPAIYNKIITC